jgi:GntR family transcriptional regulator
MSSLRATAKALPLSSETEGLLEFRRGRGISVAGRPQQEHLSSTRELVGLARANGYSREELIPIVEHAAS